MGKVRVLFLDGNTVVKNYVKELQNAKENIEVVGIVGDAIQACKMFSELLPDVIIDFKMPDLNDGFGETYWMRMINPDVSVIVITAYVDEENRYQSFQSDASGYLMLKESARIELISAN